jgi:hypothetical protein
MHHLDMNLEIYNVLENQLLSLAHWVAKSYPLGSRFCLLPAQVNLNMVHYLRRTTEGLLRRARTEENALCLLADKRGSIRFWRQLLQYNFLRLVLITCPDALPACSGPTIRLISHNRRCTMSPGLRLCGGEQSTSSTRVRPGSWR